MRMIGLLGGMSWESSAEYYRVLNERVRAHRGPTSSARCLLWSFDFSEIEALQHEGDWKALSDLMTDAAGRLEGAGADVLVICTNTMHRLAEDIEAAVDIPLLHIADPTARRIQAAGIRRIGLLGTSFTMEQGFYKDRLTQRHGLEVIIPEEEDRAAVHGIIYDELVAGLVLPSSKETFRAVINRLVEAGAEGIILGCTEIMLLVGQEDSAVPVFDTTSIHAEAAVEWALS